MQLVEAGKYAESVINWHDMKNQVPITSPPYGKAASNTSYSTKTHAYTPAVLPSPTMLKN